MVPRITGPSMMGVGAPVPTPNMLHVPAPVTFTAPAVDVLEAHHARNRPPKPPTPAVLQAAQAAQGQTAQTKTVAKKRSRTRKDDKNASSLTYYKEAPNWTDVLTDAKKEFRLFITVNTLFPSKDEQTSNAKKIIKDLCDERIRIGDPVEEVFSIDKGMLEVVWATGASHRGHAKDYIRARIEDQLFMKSHDPQASEEEKRSYTLQRLAEVKKGDVPFGWMHGEPDAYVREHARQT
ncbi:hypothetical protein BDZ89DRAFT_700238 [Hymenopellis radicata]|nr:hypothetical protein BDZ89DRAFT_700238 [Hymenopellis radicata]